MPFRKLLSLHLLIFSLILIFLILFVVNACFFSYIYIIFDFPLEKTFKPYGVRPQRAFYTIKGRTFIKKALPLSHRSDFPVKLTAHR